MPLRTFALTVDFSSKLIRSWPDLWSLDFFDNLHHLIRWDSFFEQTHDNGKGILIQIAVQVVTQLVNILKSLSAFMLLNVLFSMVAVHLLNRSILFFQIFIFNLKFIFLYLAVFTLNWSLYSIENKQNFKGLASRQAWLLFQHEASCLQKYWHPFCFSHRIFIFTFTWLR